MNLNKVLFQKKQSLKTKIHLEKNAPFLATCSFSEEKDDDEEDSLIFDGFWRSQSEGTKMKKSKKTKKTKQRQAQMASSKRSQVVNNE
jgi:hypothetical protein